jgi:hypothetical protein
MTEIRLGTKRATVVQLAALLGLIAMLGANSATALTISGSGSSPPGGGSCSVSGIPTTGSGAVVTCTGIAFGSQSSVYLGIDTATVNGLKMDSGAPVASSSQVYRSSSTAVSSITYTSTTSINSAVPAFGSDSVSNQLVLTRTAGSGTVIATGGTPANSAANGDIGHLFRITAAGTFTVVVDANSSDPHFALTQSCTGLYDPSHSTAGAGQCQSRVALKFYWSTCGDGVLDAVGESCDAGANNGTAGSCCTTSCTFKSNGTACTDDGNQCTNDQCNGVSATCQHPNKANGTACTGNGTGECSSGDTCQSGVCQNNDAAAGTACTDSSPTNCKDARCNGSNVCDQNFANEANGSGCSGNGAGECSNADTCLAGVCQDNNVAAGTGCSDLTPTNCIDAQCDGAGTCNQAQGIEANGTACAGNGTGECSNPDTCLGGSCQNNDVVAGNACGSGSDTDCDNPDTCDGSGACQANNEPNTVVCRAATGGALCDETENCDGAGNCPADAFKPNGTPCRPAAGDCDAAETCDGVSGFCPADAFEPALTPCGDPTSTDCDNPDVCDGNNNCLDSFSPAATPCGSGTDTDCDNPDTCDGSGACLINNEPGGTPCGDPSDTDCSDPDTCDGAATCLANHATNGTSCNDADVCTSGESCTTGVCGGGADVCPDLDHYKCYQGKDRKNPKFIKQVGLDTDDQLVTNELVDAKKLKFVCAPVDKNGEGINAPNRHLACYQLKAPNFSVRPKVEVSSQFQTSQFEIKKGKLLCLPATKSIIP